MTYVVPLMSLCLFLTSVKADDICDVTLRNTTQWEIQEYEKSVLKERYGLERVNFDVQGHALPYNLPPHMIERWGRLYEVCMRDGCYFCDADEGSCETGTCGDSNRDCKPYMTVNGIPQCGYECADFAFISTLP